MLNKTLTKLILVLLITSCSPNDKEYYKTNIEDAKNKLEQCNEDRSQAIKDKDKDELKAVMQDPECLASDQAIREYEREEYLANRELVKAEKAEKELKIAQELDLKYGQMSWKEYLSAFKSSECDKTSFNPSFKCVKLQQILKVKNKEAIAEISNSELEYLLTQEQEYCKTDRGRHSACSLWKEVVRVQSDQKVMVYQREYELLKHDFNKCHIEYKALRDKQKWQESVAIANSYPCNLALRAAGKLRLAYSYQKPLK